MSNEIPNRHFGLFVYLGLEFRNFFHSDLCDELSKFSKVSILTYKESDVLNAEVKINTCENPRVNIALLVIRLFHLRETNVYFTF